MPRYHRVGEKLVTSQLGPLRALRLNKLPNPSGFFGRTHRTGCFELAKGKAALLLRVLKVDTFRTMGSCGSGGKL